MAIVDVIWPAEEKTGSPNSGGGGCMVGQLYGAVVTAVDRAEAIIRPH